MSSGLMSCVRENSPPLELDVCASGPLSLPEANSSGHMQGSMNANNDGSGQQGSGAPAVNAEQQKRRRFHPLRNLRRIFRRRTITSVADTPAVIAANNAQANNNSSSEKNLRSATLSSISSVVSASSPSSPLTHQQLQDAYSSQSLPKSKSYSSGGKPYKDVLLLGSGGKQQQQQQQKEQRDHTNNADTMYTASTSSYQQSYQQHHHQRQSMGVAVLPTAMSRSFYTERQKMRSVGDSSQDLDSSGNDSGSSHLGGNAALNGSGGGGGRSGGEMSDSQRSLSEGRLVDSDYSRDALSQSHDSVFSESATASSLSIVLKAELADVLRKRRNRPDASDEDLGLPRSPASPQRRAAGHNSSHAMHSTTHNHTSSTQGGGNHSEVSSLSLLSMNSAEGEEFLAASTANNSMNTTDGSTVTSRYTRSSTMSSMSSELLRHSASASFNDSKDEIDLFSSDWQRLSHSAAKHKMAIRPAKKKGPSRQHRRTLETSIPEANEDNVKLGINHFLDAVDNDSKAKTRSLPPGVNAKILEQHADDKKITATKSSAGPAPPASPASVALNSKRTKTEKALPAATNNTKVAPTAITTTTSTISSSSNTSVFGLRTLSSKASSIFESKEATAPIETDTKRKETSSASTIETTESGFLRRLIQRNSKRTISKANNGDDDELDANQSEPKKLQISTSCLNTTNHNGEANATDSKPKSSSAYEQNLEETRKEIKREIFTEGRPGLSAMLNSFMASPTADKPNVSVKDYHTPTKPRSGPAARQRYIPQEISASNTLEKKVSPKEESFGNAFSTSILTKQDSQHQETFQSTSIIREIAAARSTTTNSTLTSSKSDYHFEKKPKIVGLSAFQQKISRSNDSFTRSPSNSNSTNSLETSSTEAVQLSYEQKQRKAVEKSRSFRTYNDERESSGVHNNMPSLPDLSLNLRVPCFTEFILSPMSDMEYSSPSPPEMNDKSVSLGFEINDNNLVKPSTARSESVSYLSGSYGKNIILTTSGNSKTTPTKLLTPSTVVSNLSPSNSCNKNISEIEQNIDLIVKSPFVSVLRKSMVISDEMAAKVATPTSANVNTKKTEESMEKRVPEYENVRPKVLHLREKTTTKTASEVTLTPTTAAVPLREKTTVTSSVRSSFDGPTTVVMKEVERKSAPVANKISPFQSTRRSSSVIESSNGVPTTAAAATAVDESQIRVPEFMKIQLNRVDPIRGKPNVVLAKNVKESSPTVLSLKDAERSASIDDLSLRRYSNESVDITEKDTPDTEKRISGIFEAINRQTKSISASSIRNSCELPPKSPVKNKLFSPVTTPTAATPTTDKADHDEVVVLMRVKSSEPTPSAAAAIAINKLSLQERKRLFMNEDKTKTDKKIEELRNERKKSISEEVYRKSSIVKSMEEKLSPESSTDPSSPTEGAVILRKKSFGAIQQTNSVNGNAVNKSKDDPTPELMKVFARRSLKIKDEDLNALTDKIMAHTNVSSTSTTTTTATTATTAITVSNTGTTSSKKFSTPSQLQQNVDSDKENQSSSEEKLDKLPKFETAAIEQVNTISKVTTTCNTNAHSNGIGNRNSLADFRHASGATKNGVSSGVSVITNGLTLSNINNNNNNNQTATAATTPSTTSSAKSFLPPIKMAGFRTMPIERNGSVNKLLTPARNESLNNNNNMLNNNSKSTLERQSMSVKSSENAVISKTIERSATVGEFKGIHQRRAEWEQRAKEALK